MDKIIDHIVEHMAVSHREMAKILESKSMVSVRMANLVGEIPSLTPGFDDFDALVEHSLDVTKSVAAYLSALADLEDAIVSNVSLIIKELQPATGDE
jgi:hypothetical protein